MEASGKLHATAALFPGKKLGSYIKGRWVDPRASLGILEMKISLTYAGIRTPVRLI
jgi:hypothetical protein